MKKLSQLERMLLIDAIERHTILTKNNTLKDFNDDKLIEIYNKYAREYHRKRIKNKDNNYLIKEGLKMGEHKLEWNVRKNIEKWLMKVEPNWNIVTIENWGDDQLYAIYLKVKAKQDKMIYDAKVRAIKKNTNEIPDLEYEEEIFISEDELLKSGFTLMEVEELMDQENVHDDDFLGPRGLK